MDDEAIAKTFSDLISNGKVRGALRFLSRKNSGGVLRLEEMVPDKTGEETVLRSVHEILKDKHPTSSLPIPCTLLHSEEDQDSTNFILFDTLNHEAILNSSLHTQGSAGPSGLDAQAWRHLCSSFKHASTNLCTALANVGKRYCCTP